MDTRSGVLYNSLDAAVAAGVPREFAMEVNPTDRQRRVMKIGRNEPCPCGSGQKFKKCCLGKRVA